MRKASAVSVPSQELFIISILLKLLFFKYSMIPLTMSGSVVAPLEDGPATTRLDFMAINEPEGINSSIFIILFNYIFYILIDILYILVYNFYR